MLVETANTAQRTPCYIFLHSTDAGPGKAGSRGTQQEVKSEALETGGVVPGNGGGNSGGERCRAGLPDKADSADRTEHAGGRDRRGRAAGRSKAVGFPRPAPGGGKPPPRGRPPWHQ